MTGTSRIGWMSEIGVDVGLLLDLAVEPKGISQTFVSYNVSGALPGSGAPPGCMYLIDKKSDYPENRLKIKPEL